MTTTTRLPLRETLKVLRQAGLLLESDPRRPSVAGLVAGGPIKGSWWGHPEGKRIFNLCGALEDHPDVLRVKLLHGKVTYVHRALWPALWTVVTAGDPWQTTGLSPEARRLRASVDRAGTLGGEGLPKGPAQELERRLLVLSTSVHTPSGHHEKALESWESWRERAGLETPALAKADAYAALAAVGGDGFPWS